jgi:hypothetical protein
MTARDRTFEREPAGGGAAPDGGRPLAPPVRREMEARLGHSFADVRVHSDAQAAASARELGAQAYAFGRDVVFGAGRFSLGTRAGRALLAHELAHVVQQRGAPAGAEPEAAEAEAARAGRAVAGGLRFAPQARTGPGLALQAEEEAEAAPEPAPEAAAREERATVAAAFEQEQLSFARDRIAFVTAAISRDFADLLKRPEAERAPLRAKLYGLERQLARALADNSDLLTRRIADLGARAASGEDVGTEIAEAQRELAANRADLETMKGVFSPEKGAAFEETYRNKVAGLHCMGAAYAGLGALTSPEAAAEVKRQVEEKAEAGMKRKRPVNLDQFITVMDSANAEKIAGPKQRARWSKRTRTWTPTLETLVRSKVHARIPGFYFFGLALAEAFHSVMIGVSTWGEAPRTLWCDQYGCTEVEGRLDDFARAKAEAWKIGYGDWDSYVWQVLPPAEAGLLTAEEKKP